MGIIKVRYLIEKSYKGKIYRYWQPKERYFVAGEWKKCPLKPQELPSDTSKATAKASELNEQLDAWRGQREVEFISKDGSFSWLIGEYKKSRWFRELGKRTAKEYGYVLDSIRQTLQDRKIKDALASDFTKQHARALHHIFENTPRKAQLVVAISRIVFNYGIETGLLKENPFKDLRIRKRPARELIWLALDHEKPLWMIDAIQASALALGMPSIALAVDIALYTAQREGDILALSRNKYDGSAIKLRQRKTGAWIEVPVMPVLKNSLDKAPLESPTFLISEKTGKPYTKDHFGDVFREVRAHANIANELQFRDLRKTSIVMLALSGCTDTEITSISGHTNSEVSDILEVYLPRNSAMARNAMVKMKRVFGDGSWKKSPVIS